MVGEWVRAGQGPSSQLSLACRWLAGVLSEQPRPLCPAGLAADAASGPGRLRSGVLALLVCLHVLAYACLLERACSAQ